MTDKKLDIKLWPIGDLTPYELNVKKHDREQVARIVQSISKFGWDQPIVVDKHGVIIKGHGRRLAALELGLKTVPVLVRADLNPEQVRAARLSDNRAAISDIDPEMLKLELASLDLDLDGIFDAKELDFISADLGTMNEEMFVTDMDQVLADQKKDIDARMEKVSGADTRMPIAKAFGFKDISAAGKLAISNLMAKAEAATGLKNDEALVAWAAGIA
jgi:hypothetical protein